jgi:transcriptional regulator with XRE-family HTH domain
MKQNNKIQPFENLLKAYISKESEDAFVSSTLDKEAEIVFTKQYDSVLAQDKVDTLLLSLTQSLSVDTLGNLVQKGLIENGLSMSEIQSQTGLSESLLKDIESDMIFTNSIPVKSLVKLLKSLNISLDKALTAIYATYDKLSTESKLFLSIPAITQPAFRKGASQSNPTVDFNLKSDESYLYQNKEALEKYSKRFSELYNEL